MSNRFAKATPVEYIPGDTNLMLQAGLMKDAEIQKDLNDWKNKIDYLGNMATLGEKDTTYKNSYFDQTRESLKEIVKTTPNLTSIESKMKLNDAINKSLRDPKLYYAQVNYKNWTEAFKVRDELKKKPGGWGAAEEFRFQSIWNKYNTNPEQGPDNSLLSGINITGHTSVEEKLAEIAKQIPADRVLNFKNPKWIFSNETNNKNNKAIGFLANYINNDSVLQDQLDKEKDLYNNLNGTDLDLNKYATLRLSASLNGLVFNKEGLKVNDYTKLNYGVALEQAMNVPRTVRPQTSYETRSKDATPEELRNNFLNSLGINTSFKDDLSYNKINGMVYDDLGHLIYEREGKYYRNIPPSDVSMSGATIGGGEEEVKQDEYKKYKPYNSNDVYTELKKSYPGFFDDWTKEQMDNWIREESIKTQTVFDKNFGVDDEIIDKDVLSSNILNAATTYYDEKGDGSGSLDNINRKNWSILKIDPYDGPRGVVAIFSVNDGQGNYSIKKVPVQGTLGESFRFLKETTENTRKPGFHVIDDGQNNYIQITKLDGTSTFVKVLNTLSPDESSKKLKELGLKSFTDLKKRNAEKINKRKNNTIEYFQGNFYVPIVNDDENTILVESEFINPASNFSYYSFDELQNAAYDRGLTGSKKITPTSKNQTYQFYGSESGNDDFNSF